MLRIKKISIGSAFNVGLIFSALYWGVAGLFIVILPSLGNTEPSFFESQTPSLGESIFSYIIGLPLSAIFGGLGTALGALFYNITAQWTGGLTLEVSQTNEADPFMATRNIALPESESAPTQPDAASESVSTAGYPPVGGRTDNMAILQEASRLIRDQQYQTAYDMLLSLPDHPTAQKWLDKLRDLDPTLTASNPDTPQSGDGDDWSPVNFD